MSSLPSVYLFGDSQTQFSFDEEGCWGALLANRLQRRCDVFNRGFSGYNTRWCAAMLPCVIQPHQAPNVFAVTIMLGSNDAAPQDNESMQHVPLSEYQVNLENMVTYLKGIGISKDSIILVSPPPVDADKWNDYCVTGNVFKKHGGLSNDVMSTYAEASARAAKSTDVVHLDIYGEMVKTEKWKSFVEVDGLHLSKKGSQFLFDRLWQLLQSRAQALPSFFPVFEDMQDDLEVRKAVDAMRLRTTTQQQLLGCKINITEDAMANGAFHLESK